MPPRPGGPSRPSGSGFKILIVCLVGILLLALYLTSGNTKRTTHHLVPMRSKDREQRDNTLNNMHKEAISLATQQATAAIRDDDLLREEHTVSFILVIPSGHAHHEKLIARQMLALPFIKELVLWQDGGEVDPSLQNLAEKLSATKFGGTKPVRYFHSKEHLHEKAKYMACSSKTSSKTSVCMFQSPYYSTLGYASTLYASFLRSPNLLHVAVDPVTFFHDNELRFTFREAIHAGFANLKFGSIVKKEHVSGFLKARKLAASAEQRFADAFFTLWLNQPPVMLCNPIDKLPRGLGQVKVVHRNSYERRMEKEQRAAELTSLRQLIATTQMVSQSTTATTPHLVPRPDAYSSCSDDRCLMITNMKPMREPAEAVRLSDLVVSFERIVEGDCGGKVILERERCVPHVARTFAMLNYHHAVDRSPTTLWVSHGNATQGDYFGIDLVQPRRHVENITVLAAHPFQSTLELQVSIDGHEFVPVPSTPAVRDIETANSRHLRTQEYVYPLQSVISELWATATTHDNLPPLFLRFIRFVATRDVDAPFAVAEIDVGHDVDVFESTHGFDMDVDTEEELGLDR